MAPGRFQKPFSWRPTTPGTKQSADRVENEAGAVSLVSAVRKAMSSAFSSFVNPSGGIPRVGAPLELAQVG